MATRQEGRLEAFHRWLTATYAKLAPGIRIAKAVMYPLKRWPGLLRYLANSNLATDNYPV